MSVEVESLLKRIGHAKYYPRLIAAGLTSVALLVQKSPLIASVVPSQQHADDIERAARQQAAGAPAGNADSGGDLVLAELLEYEAALRKRLRESAGDRATKMVLRANPAASGPSVTKMRLSQLRERVEHNKTALAICQSGLKAHRRFVELGRRLQLAQNRGGDLGQIDSIRSQMAELSTYVTNVLIRLAEDRKGVRPPRWDPNATGENTAGASAVKEGEQGDAVENATDVDQQEATATVMDELRALCAEKESTLDFLHSKLETEMGRWQEESLRFAVKSEALQQSLNSQTAQACTAGELLKCAAQRESSVGPALDILHARLAERDAIVTERHEDFLRLFSVSAAELMMRKNTEIIQIRSTHSAELAAAKSTHDSQLQSLLERHADERRSMEVAASSSLAEAQVTYNAEVTRATEAAVMAASNHKVALEAQAADAERAIALALEQQQRAHESEISKLKSEAAAVLSALERRARNAEEILGRPKSEVSTQTLPATISVAGPVNWNTPQWFKTEQALDEKDEEFPSSMKSCPTRIALRDTLIAFRYSAGWADTCSRIVCAHAKRVADHFPDEAGTNDANHLNLLATQLLLIVGDGATALAGTVTANDQVLGASLFSAHWTTVEGLVGCRMPPVPPQYDGRIIRGTGPPSLFEEVVSTQHEMLRVLRQLKSVEFCKARTTPLKDPLQPDRFPIEIKGLRRE